MVIVTRDSDYGAIFDKQSILNDWLATEFRERISKKRQLLLTDRLSAALKLASIPVTKQEVATESALISERRAHVPNLVEALRRSLAAVTVARPAKPSFVPDPYEGYEPEADEPQFDPDFDSSDFEPDHYEPEPDDYEPPELAEPDEPEPDER